MLDALGGPPPLDALGRLLEGGALLAATWVVDAPLFRTRGAVLARAQARQRELGQTPRPWPPLSSDLVAAEWLLRTAYAWLVVAGALLLLGGALALGGGPLLPADVERHALGTGFVTLLISAWGRGCCRDSSAKPTSPAQGWSGRTVWLGNAAALLRVAPPLVVWLLALAAPAATPPAALTNGLLALSGLLGLAAVACFTINLWRTLR